MAAPQGTTWQGAGVFPLIDNHDPIDQDIVDADGVVLRVFSGGVGLDRLGIEDDDIGLEAVAQQAPVGKP